MKTRFISILLSALLLLSVPALASDFSAASAVSTGIILADTQVYDGMWNNANNVGTLAAGTGVIVLQTYNGWVQVHARAQRVVGWVPGNMVQIDSGIPVYPGIVISQNVSLREGQSTGSRRLASIPNGTILELLDEQNGWYYVSYWDGKSATPMQGWALVDYIVRNPSYITTTKSTYVYSTPDRGAKKVGQLISGTQLVVIGEWGDFWVVNLRSASGFIYKRDVEDNYINGGNG